MSNNKVPNPKEKWGYYIHYEPYSFGSFFVIIKKMTEWDFDDVYYVSNGGRYCYCKYKPADSIQQDFLFDDLQKAEFTAKEVIEAIKRKEKLMDDIRYKNSFPNKIADL